MNIGKLTAQEKSVMLAKLMGWHVETMPTGNYGKRGEQYRAYWTKPNGDEKADDIVGYSEEEAAEVQVTNFYLLWNFDEAWRVLGWASDMASRASYEVFGTIDPNIASEWIDAIDYLLMDIWRNSGPAEAQAAWLDKVLSLAIEASLITPEPTNAPL